MPIVETKKEIRENTDIVFWWDAVDQNTTVTVAAEAAGKLTRLKETSHEGLVGIYTLTFADLETYSAFDTAQSIAMRAQVANYRTLNSSLYGNGNFGDVKMYAQSGLDDPFTLTVEYVFPAASDLLSSLINELEFSYNLIDLVATVTSVTSTHRFEHSEEFNLLKFNDRDVDLVLALNAENAVYTRTYALTV